MQFTKTITTAVLLAASVAAAVPSPITSAAINTTTTTTTDLELEQIAVLSAKYAEMATNIAAGFTNTTTIADRSIDKRTCGSLKGTLLSICQQACVATCAIASAGLASSLCQKACTAGNL